MKVGIKRVCAAMMSAVIVIGTLSGITEADAAKQVKLNKKKVSLHVGEKAVVKLVNGNKKGKVTWKIAKKSVAKITKKVVKGKKASATVKAVKIGSTSLTAAYKYGSVSRKLTCKIKVSEEADKNDAEQTVTPASDGTTNQPSNTIAPVQTDVPSPVQTEMPTAKPTEVPSPTPKIISPEEAVMVTDRAAPDDYDAYNDNYTFSTEKYPSNITGTDRSVDIVLPKDYNPEKEYPVLIMIHGIGLGGSRFGSGSGCGPAKIAYNIVDAGECDEFILVIPDTRVSNIPETGENTHTAENYSYYDLFNEELFDSLFPWLYDNYSIKKGRENTAIAGWSMGGREALYIGVSHPDVFGYIGAFCPAPGLFEYYIDENRNEPGLFEKDKFMIPEPYTNNTFLMILKGIYDDVVNEHPLTYHQALTDNGFDHIYYEYPVGHSWEHGYYNFMRNVFK